MTASQECIRWFRISWSYIASEGPWGSRDVEVEAEGQRPADAEAGGQSPANVGGQRSEGQRGPESESGVPRSAESGSELEDK